jgi:hypothetical protein
MTTDPRRAIEPGDRALHHGAIDVGVAARLDRVERPDHALELLATARTRHRLGAGASEERQTDGIPRPQGDARERGGQERREGHLRPGRAGSAKPHRRRRVDDEAKRAVGLRLELAHQKVLMAHERSPVEPAQIVAGHVFAIAAELDAGAAKGAAVRTGVDALGHLTCADPQRGQLGPEVVRAQAHDDPFTARRRRAAADPRSASGPGRAGRAPGSFR